MVDLAYTGEIRCFPYAFIPAYWAACAGQVLPQSRYTALYAVIGNTYGGSAAQGTFALPNLMGKVAICADTNQSTGFPNRAFAQEGGVTEVSLTADQLPNHTHQVNVVVGGTMQMPISQFVGETDDPNGAVLAIPADHTNIYSLTPDSAMAAQTAYVSNNIHVTDAPGCAGTPHNNMQPTMALTYCICLMGEFPVRP